MYRKRKGQAKCCANPNRTIVAINRGAKIVNYLCTICKRKTIIGSLVQTSIFRKLRKLYP